jgi:acyl-activating enzyme 14
MATPPEPRPHIAGYLAAAAAAGHPAGGAPLWSCEGVRSTAAEAAARVGALADALADAVAPGARVAILARPTPAALEALLAVAAAGCVAAPLNARWAPADAAAAAVLLGAEAVVADAALLPLALAALSAAAAPLLVLLGGDADFAGAAPRAALAAARAVGARVAFAGVLAGQPRDPSSNRPVITLRWAPDGAAVAVFTSGTSGAPRAALLSHAGLDFQARAKAACQRTSSSDLYLHAAPLFHVGGLASALAALAAGAAHAFLPAYSPAAALAAIRAERATVLIAVPATAADLAAAAAPGEALPSVRALLVGAGGLGPTLAARLAALFPRAEILTAYGLTEGGSSLTFAAAGELGGGVSGGGGGAYVGRPPPGIELGVVPAGLPEDASPFTIAVAASGEGEVVTRGPHLMLRYWAAPTATSAARLPGGWLRTGDLGRLGAAGGLWLAGRVRDVVRSGGESVPAWEVEAATAAHAGVAAAAVVPVPDARLGEAVGCAVELAPGWRWAGGACQRPPPRGEKVASAELAPRTLDGAALQAHCRAAGLAAFKVPRVFLRVGALPRGATGKVAKAELRAALAAAAAALGAPRARL